MITFAAVAALLSCAGCIVTASTYDAKVREVEALRDAYASSNRETSKLAGEVEALSKQVAAQKAALQELSSRADAVRSGTDAGEAGIGRPRPGTRGAPEKGGDEGRTRAPAAE